MLEKTPQIEWQKIKAVIFDVDGTLYNQDKLRRIMLLELLKYYLLHPWRLKELKMLFDFRREREKHADTPTDNLDSAQYEWGAKASNVSSEKVRKVVGEWIYNRPLPFLRRCRCHGLAEFIAKLHECGIATAVFSDYPAEAKIAALGLPEMLTVASTDANVNRLKPDPTGLLVIANKLKIPVGQCLFIGDREDRDQLCAENAGMPFLLISPDASYPEHGFASYTQLKNQLEQENGA